MTTKILAFISGRYPPEHNGAAKIFEETASNLMKKNSFSKVIVHVLSANETCDVERNGLAIKKFKKMKVPFVFMRSLYLLFIFAKYFKFFLFRPNDNDEVVHGITVTWDVLIILSIARFFNKKTSLESTLLGDVLTKRSQKNVFTKVLDNFKFFLLRRIDKFKVYSEGLKEELKLAGICENKIFLIPPGVDTDIFYSSEKPVAKDMGRLLNCELGSGSTIFLYVGAVGYRKGYDLAYQAFEKLLIEGKDITFVAVGPIDANFDENPSRLKNIYLTRRKVDNVADFMRAADVFLLPTRLEGFGLVFAEAMACKLAIIAGKIPGVTDYILERKLGIVVDHNPESIIEAMLIMTDKAKRDIYSLNAFKYFTKNLTIERSVNAMKDYFR